MSKRVRPTKLESEEVNPLATDAQVSPERLHQMKIIKQDERARKNLKVTSQRYVITKSKVYLMSVKNNGNEYSSFVCNNSSKFKKLIDQVKAQKEIPVEISL